MSLKNQSKHDPSVEKMLRKRQPLFYDYIKDLGFIIYMRKGGHICLEHHKHGKMFVSSSPSDINRAQKNNLSFIKRKIKNGS
jgi:predicted RNA binding protein YcfA (HicA-like mRNA interferase family)